MGFTITFTLFIAMLAFAIFAGWRDSRPPGFSPRLLPWRVLMMLAGVAILILGVHLFNLAGVDTGRTQPGGP